MTDAFAFYLAHKGVVVNAVKRVHPSHDFEDYVEEGMLYYINYFNQYQPDTTDPADVVKFNRLAGYFVYQNLVSAAQAARRHATIEAATAQQVPTDVPDAYLAMWQAPEAAETLSALIVQLTPREQAVLKALLVATPIRNIATQLAISPHRVYVLRQQIQAKYRALTENQQ
jgi:RNA polymerase sigma factor (sigma-70 family)